MSGSPPTSRPTADRDERRLVELTQQAYDATADRYAARWNTADPMEEAKRRFLAVAGSPSAVVDLGCGTGRDMSWFADRGLRVVGIDRSAAMLSIAKRTAPTARLIQADVRQLPLRSESVDAWWACASLLHLPPAGMATALSEARRVTRHDGVGLVTVREGVGARLERVSNTGHRRYFCYWTADDLDHAVERAGWRIMEGWGSRDSLGRQPWITRVVTRSSSPVASCR